MSKENLMGVARSDDESPDLPTERQASASGAPPRRRPLRRTGESAVPTPRTAPAEGEREREHEAASRPAAPVPPPERRPAPEPRPRGPLLRLDDLYRLPMPKLFQLAEREGISEHTGMNRAQLIVGVVREQIKRGETVRGSGTLEVLPDGYGFLRSAAHNYLASPEDIYVSPSQIRRLGLRTGLVVEGPIAPPGRGQEYFALMQVDAVTSHPPDRRL